MVGGPWSMLKQAFYAEEAANLLVVDYELLARAPEKVLRLVYEFIGEPWFAHDYQSLAYDEPEFDRNLGLPDLHKVRAQVQLQPRRSILPPDLFAQYSQLSFWQQAADSAARVIAVKPKPQEKDRDKDKEREKGKAAKGSKAGKKPAEPQASGIATDSAPPLRPEASAPLHAIGQEPLPP